MLNVSLLQGGGLSNTRAYLDNCSTVTAFVNKALLDDITTVRNGMKINCNAGVVRTNQRSRRWKIEAW